MEAMEQKNIKDSSGYWKLLQSNVYVKIQQTAVDIWRLQRIAKVL
jgi:hypothetical protein